MHQKAAQAAIVIDRQSGVIRDQKEALDAQEQTAKRLERVAQLQTAQHEDSMRRLRASITAENEAIKLAPEWAGVPVPAPVVDWLRKH
jgi:hypothetical protein